MAHVPAAERRPQLIKAAIDFMSREGVAAGTTRAIAAELGVAQATVHYTFGTKEELYRAVMDQLTKELVTEVERAAPEGAGFEETVSTLAAALWRTVREHPGNHQLLNELSMVALRSPQLTGTMAEHDRWVTDVASRLITEAAERTGVSLSQPAETLARFFLAGFDGLARQRFTQPDEEAERTCLQTLVSAVIALAGGRLDLVPIPCDQDSQRNDLRGG